MEYILEAKNIIKTFPGVKALDNVNLEVKKGEVHGLVGENGAGKSTLMHILAGVYKPDSGTIVLEGQVTEFMNERHAQVAGIGMVFQERSLVGNLNIAENIFAGRQPTKFLGIVDKKTMYAMTTDLLKQVGLDLDPSTPVSSLSSIEKQLVEITKALSLNAKILILDEPTATITEIETQTLFQLIRELQSKGISIIYISHRLEELPSICDRVTVLKDGLYQGTHNMSDVTLDQIVTLMVGREILNVYEDRDWKPEETILEVDNLSSKAFQNISFCLRKQEILGIAGLAGAGRTELALALFGYDPHVTGEIYVKGKEVRFKSPTDAIQAGIGYLTEDRKEAGLFSELTVSENIAAVNLKEFTKKGILIDQHQINKRSQEYINNLNVSTPSLQQQILYLSGGNQQKILLARWLVKNPEILIIDEPTRGIDVGAKSEIYELIRQMAKKDTSIIIISSELPEILTLCDTVIVMCQGQKTGDVPHHEATEEKLMHLSAGIMSKS